MGRKRRAITQHTRGRERARRGGSFAFIWKRGCTRNVGCRPVFSSGKSSSPRQRCCSSFQPSSSSTKSSCLASRSLERGSPADWERGEKNREDRVRAKGSLGSHRIQAR